MKRSITRYKRLPAFAIDLGTLKLLVADVERQFNDEKFASTVELPLAKEKLEFDDLHDLEAHQAKLPGRVTAFEITWLTYGDLQNSRHCAVANGILGGSVIRVSGSDDAWCAGVIVLIEKYALSNRRWYAPLRQWHFFAAAIILGLAPGLFPWILNRHLVSNVVGLVAYLILLILIWLLAIVFYAVFPQRTLIIRAKDNWFRTYSPELTLAIAVLSLIVSVLALFLQK